MVEKCVTQFLKCGCKSEQIGVITPYEGQRAYLVNYMRRIGTMPQHVYEEIDGFIAAGAQHLLLNPVFDFDEHLEALARYVPAG